MCFKNASDARKALDAYSHDESSDASNRSDKLYVVEAKSKEQRQLEIQKSTYRFKVSMMNLNLIIKNLDPSTTEDEFLTLCEQFGQV